MNNYKNDSENDCENNSENNICPICHEIINFSNPESYIIFNCCNQLSHIECLILWTNSEFSKSNKSNIKYSCIMCQQQNDIIRDIADNLYIQNNTETYLNNSQNINNQITENSSNNSENIIESNIYNNVQDQNINQLRYYIKKNIVICKTIGCIISLFIITPIIIIIIL